VEKGTSDRVLPSARIPHATLEKETPQEPLNRIDDAFGVFGILCWTCRWNGYMDLVESMYGRWLKSVHLSSSGLRTG
jgi:hypothetical protein